MADIRRIHVHFADTDLAMLAEMQHRTGMSRSKLVRLAIKSHYGDATARIGAERELAQAMVETARAKPN